MRAAENWGVRGDGREFLNALAQRWTLRLQVGNEALLARPWAARILVPIVGAATVLALTTVQPDRAECVRSSRNAESYRPPQSWTERFMTDATQSYLDILSKFGAELGLPTVDVDRLLEAHKKTSKP